MHRAVKITSRNKAYVSSSRALGGKAKASAKILALKPIARPNIPEQIWRDVVEQQNNIIGFLPCTEAGLLKHHVVVVEFIVVYCRPIIITSTESSCK